MAFDLDEVKETVKAIAVRLDSPASSYNLVFSESDEAVEVRVDQCNSIDPLFIFVVTADEFRVIKDLEINPNGYPSFSYHGCVELLSYILEYFYPVFYKLNHGASIMDMASRVLGQNIRIWKDLIRVICKAGEVEYYDFGHTVSVLGVNFSYNLEFLTLRISGDIEESIKCQNVMELVTAILTYLSYLFKRDEFEVNPILGNGLAEEGEIDFGDMEETMDMEADIDAGLDEPMGEDLEGEFEPAGDSLDSVGPDLDEGKAEIMDDVMGG